MAENIAKLREILGDARFRESTNQTDEDNPQVALTNAKKIHCECKTLILRPGHAKLIVPTEHMLTLEKQHKTLKPSDSSFKNLCNGCYWLVDDMYKFEQIGYTKEVQSLIRDNPSSPETNEHSSSSTQAATTKEGGGLRYLACAECNFCPLGWFDPATKESYLYVW